MHLNESLQRLDLVTTACLTGRPNLFPDGEEPRRQRLGPGTGWWQISDAPPDYRWNRGPGPRSGAAGGSRQARAADPGEGRTRPVRPAAVAAAVHDADAVLHLATRTRPLNLVRQPEEWLRG